MIRAILIAALVAAPGVARADDFADADQAGDAAFTQDKAYARARELYEKAYAIRHEALLLYKIAQTYRYDGASREAIDYYKRYLAESAASELQRRNAEDYIRSLEAQLAVATPPAKPDPKPDVAPPPPREEVVRHRRIPLASKIAAGVAGAGLVSTLVLTKIGLSAEHDLHADPNATQADADRVARDQDLINISLGVTAAAAATAVVLYFAAPSYTTERRTIVVGPMRDGGWAASLAGRF